MNEIENGFKIVRSFIDDLESRAAQEPQYVRAKLVEIVALFYQTPNGGAGRKARGLGFDIDEAMIVAFRGDHGGSIEASARAHWAGEREDMVEAKIRRLYRHKKEIDDAGLGGDY